MSKTSLTETGSTVILDTGCANLASVFLALERLDANPVISAGKSALENADRVIIPGVGSAQKAMEYLQSADLVSCLRKLSCPVLGICLGMQLMGSFSEEGNVGTLGIIDCEVKKLSPVKDIRLPHMGWNRVAMIKAHPLLNHIADGSHFYFVHGYAFAPEKHMLAWCEHGERFSAVIQKDNFMGVQFHPERSGKNGMRLLANFVQMKTGQEVNPS